MGLGAVGAIGALMAFGPVGGLNLDLSSRPSIGRPWIVVAAIMEWKRDQFKLAAEVEIQEQPGDVASSNARERSHRMAIE